MYYFKNYNCSIMYLSQAIYWKEVVYSDFSCIFCIISILNMCLINFQIGLM